MEPLVGGVYDTYGRHASGGGQPTGLRVVGDGLELNGRPIRLVSGAVHYFRVHPHYWGDRLAKLRAAGFLCVETYVPWNLHEPQRGQFDFGSGGDALSPFLDLAEFLREAQRRDLLVILRPGPYICAEWDYGGLPSWLLRERHQQVRSSHPGFLDAATRFLGEVLGRVAALTFPRGGPIVAVQVENEFGTFGYEDLPRDGLYLRALHDHMTELLPSDQVLYFTSDTPGYTGDLGAIPGVLQTANFQTTAVQELTALRRLQPEGPQVVMEFWSGWFNHWMEPHKLVWPVEEFSAALEQLLKAQVSVNVFMFHGGTNFGFLAGANVQKTWPYYAPDVTSYDYDALLTESGDYTAKYQTAKQLVGRHLADLALTCPPAPPHIPATSYPDVPLTRQLPLHALLKQVGQVSSEELLAMEDLPINGGCGQSFGCILYRTFVDVAEAGSRLQVRGHVRDLALVLLDGCVVSPRPAAPAHLDGFGTWVTRDASLDIAASWAGRRRLEVLVENLGRTNFGKPHHFGVRKGLSEGPVLLDGRPLKHWTIFPLEFRSEWINGLSDWEERGEAEGAPEAPVVLQGELEVTGPPRDTFVDACGWGKGCIFINGFNLGRFWSVGPQRTLYLPAPLLVQGKNKVTVWSMYGGEGAVSFTATHDLGETDPSGVTPGSGTRDLILVPAPQ